MNARIKVGWLKELQGTEVHNNVDVVYRDRITKLIRYQNDEEMVTVDLAQLNDTRLLETLRGICFKHYQNKDSRGYNAHYAIKQQLNLFADTSGDVKVPNPKEFPVLIKRWLAKTPDKWVYKEMADGKLCPMFLVSATYNPPRRGDYGYVDVELAYRERGVSRKTTVTFYNADIRSNKKTTTEIFRSKGFYRQTDNLDKQYAEEMEAFARVNAQRGSQWLGTGMAQKAKKEDHYWWREASDVSLIREGQQVRLVADNATDEVPVAKNDSYHSDRSYDTAEIISEWHDWSASMVKKATTSTGEDDEDEVEIEPEQELIQRDTSRTVLPPTAPYVICFDLDSHQWLKVHSSNLIEYEYASNLDDKVYLPDSHRELVSTLLLDAGDRMEDIVAGKSGGTIVLATGIPGTGKTLTAQAYAEAIKRPLYVVQCSQLGISVDKVEENLVKVLNRAGNWSAVLLIDEADVYIRSREADITQNAIVGVFLRVLETYRGVLFFTSNRATVIDDAVLSRCTAHVRYGLPGEDGLKVIWPMLAEQLGVEVETGFFDDVVKAFPGISGRDVKSMLKLMKPIAKRRGVKVDIELARWAAVFQDFTGKAD